MIVQPKVQRIQIIKHHLWRINFNKLIQFYINAKNDEFKYTYKNKFK